MSDPNNLISDFPDVAEVRARAKRTLIAQRNAVSNLATALALAEQRLDSMLMDSTQLGISIEDLVGMTDMASSVIAIRVSREDKCRRQADS